MSEYDCTDPANPAWADCASGVKDTPENPEYESQADKPFEHDSIIYSHRARELDTLRQFRDKAVALWGEKAWDDGLSFIADPYWDEWAADQAESIYGEAAKTVFWDDELWSEKQIEEFTSIIYDETEYWGDGKS